MDEARRIFTACPDVAGVPHEVSGMFLYFAREAHKFCVGEGVLEATPEDERRLMAVMAEKLKDAVVTDPDTGARWMLVTGQDAPALQ